MMKNAMTYEEPIGRYRIFRNDNMLGERGAQIRAEGHNAENDWRLVWSFNELEAASMKFAQESMRSGAYSLWKIVDAGENAPKTITRTVW